MTDIETIARHYGQTKQLDQLIEKCAELILAARKFLRMPTLENLAHIAEEMADVKLMLAQLEILLKNSDGVREVLHLERQLKRIENETQT